MSQKIETMPYAIWTIKDVLAVIVFVFTGFTLSYIVLHISLSNEKTIFTFLHYIGPLLTAFVPIFWIKKKLGLTKEVLGLRKGDLSFWVQMLIGAVSAIIYFFLIQMTPFKFDVPPVDLKNSYSTFNLILLPLSIGGFPITVLTPISEEIMIRGFLYGYFRKKLRVIFSLFLQALLFSLLHFNIYGNATNAVVQSFIIGLILGFLYEKTGSLYPSMLCHGAVNYLSIVTFMLHK